MVGIALLQGVGCVGQEESEASTDSAISIGSFEWKAPPVEALGNPVVTSNNPEEFHGDGLLFGTGNSSARRPLDPVLGTPQTVSLDRFGIYLHHINKSKGKKYVSVLISNPNAAEVTVRGKGSAYQTDDGFHTWSRAKSPSQAVSRDWLEESLGDRGRQVKAECPGSPDHTTGLQHEKTMRIAGRGSSESNYELFWQEQLGEGANVDGRFWINASAPVYAYVVVSSDNKVESVYAASLKDAPGDVRAPGHAATVTLDMDFDPRTKSDRRPVATETLGREAGVYAADTARLTLDVPAPKAGVGSGYFLTIDAGPKSVWRHIVPEGAVAEQTFPALMAYRDSAQRSVGMYGAMLDVRARLQNPTAAPVKIAARLVSFGCAQSRCYDGWIAVMPGGVASSKRYVHAVTTPAARVKELGRFDVAAGGSTALRLMAMVPGLSTIPQAIVFETVAAGAPAPAGADSCGK